MKSNQQKNVEGDFICCHCSEQVKFSNTLGTEHRNHCPKCLYSLHLDKEVSGDRSASCGGYMPPIGLTFKQEGFDKYGKKREGELMLIHQCVKCARISINRLAADDDERAIIVLFNKSIYMDEKTKKDLADIDIIAATADDKNKVFIKLFGKSIN